MDQSGSLLTAHLSLLTCLGGTSMNILRSGDAAARRTHGYTLLEVLVVVAVLGVAGAMVVPSMSQTGVLRVQAAVRTIVADITFAQSDALAYQRRRGIVFLVEENGYVLTEVNGPTIDIDTDALYSPDLPDGRYHVRIAAQQFAGAQITSADFDGDNVLVFDELGGPVLTPDGDAPSAGGSIYVSGSGFIFRIDIEAYTGRVTVERVSGG